MQKRLSDLYFNVSFSIPLIIVLEPSEEGWERIYRIADGLVQGLPGRIGELHFLGGTRRYPVSVPRDFRDHIPRWFHENRGRVALIGSILERLAREGFRGMVVAVCTGPPIDLEDWIDTEPLERVLFVNLGEEAFAGDCSTIDGRLGIERMIDALDNPPLEISVEGAGFVPLCWEVHPERKAEVVCEDGGFRLKIPPSEERLELHLKALCGELPPSLHIKRARGQSEMIRGKEELPWFHESRWVDLPETLKPVVEAGISKGEYLCPQCHERHRYNTYICPEGDMVLKGMPLGTCLLFTREKVLPLSERYAHPLRDGQRIVTREGDLYERMDKGWTHLGRIDPFDEVDDGVWGLFHRA